MKKTKVISVTERDIKNGQRGDCMSCPVALAVRRAFKKGRNKVAVCEGIYTGKSPTIRVGAKEFKAPHMVHEFVEKFDSLYNMLPSRPFTFTLEY